MSGLYRIDRIEENIFVCISEDEKSVNVPASFFPAECAEGWYVRISGDFCDPKIEEILQPDKEKTKSAKNRFDKLFKKST